MALNLWAVAVAVSRVDLIAFAGSDRLVARATAAARRELFI